MIKASNLEAASGIRHGFFTREGGTSSGIYASLNCGAGSKDDPMAVSENRKRVARALGADADALVTPYQIHSADVVLAEDAWTRGSAPRADAVVTKTPGLAVGVLTADCAPVLFADPDAGIVAAAHAGWRGARGGVLEAALDRMEREGADRARIRAAIGPAISQAAYEVGEEFRECFVSDDPGHTEYFERPDGGKPHFDLIGFAFDRLRAAGLEHVEALGVCTYADGNRLFSYRRTVHRAEPDYGRQISAIVLAR